MLSKKNRLAKDLDIKKVFARGRSFLNSGISLRFLPKAGAGDARFAVVVSTKVSKRATKRNRLKRLIREELKSHLKTFPYGDYIISVRPTAEKLEEKKFLDLAAQIFLKVGMQPGFKND